MDASPDISEGEVAALVGVREARQRGEDRSVRDRSPLRNERGL